MDETAPVIDRTGSQYHYHYGHGQGGSRGLFGFFGGFDGTSTKGGFNGSQDFKGGRNGIGGDYYYHLIDGYHVSWYHKARYMRRCATVSFLRMMFVGRLIANQYSIESDENTPEEITDLCRENFKCWWPEIIKHASFGCMDFGWQGFELPKRLKDGLWHVDKVKPLLQDMTYILEDRRSGEFLGYRQNLTKLYVDDGGVLLFNFLGEGTYHYGYAPLKALECAFDRQCTLYENIEQYDGRLASTHWAIYYPLGKTQISGFDDPASSFATSPEHFMDNYDIAVKTMQHLLMTGSVIIPSSIDESINRLNELGGNAKGPWRIEVLSPGEGSSGTCLLYTSPSPRDGLLSRMPSSA